MENKHQRTNANLLHKCFKSFGIGSDGMEIHVEQVISHGSRQIRDLVSLPFARIAVGAIVYVGMYRKPDGPCSFWIAHPTVAPQRRAAATVVEGDGRR
jgi:hypothetical protein